MAFQKAEMLRRVGVAATLAKARRRLASSTCCLELTCDLARRGDRAPEAVIPLVFDVERPSDLAFPADRLPTAVGADLLFVRGVEAVRRVGAGEVVVARGADGSVVGSCFLFGAEDGPGLDAASPNMYPPLRPDEAYTEVLYVVPELRGRRVAPALLAAALDRLAERGVRSAHAWVDVDNASSLRTFARNGYRPGLLARHDRFVLGRRRSSFVDAGPRELRRFRQVVDAVGADAG